MPLASSPARAVTRAPRHHFFGYYDKPPWDASGRYLLGMDVGFMHRAPGAEDPATVGLIDLAEGNSWRALAETTAWSWQQGSMLQWMPNAADRLIIYNSRQGERFVSVIQDVHTGERRVLPLPIYSLSPDGRSALTLNFSRLQWARPGYGYPGIPDPWREEASPDDDGIYWMDLASGEHRRILSLAQVVATESQPSMQGVSHRIEHLSFNTDGSRWLFLHRWARSGGGYWTRMLTANPEGQELYVLADYEIVSHFDRRTPREVLAWARERDPGERFFLYTDRTQEMSVVGEGLLTSDGHCSYSPDRRWILTDTYPDREHKRRLMLYRERDGKLVELGRFHSPPELTGELRCDLHPRWSRDGRTVCIDSAHQGHRQIYLLDVSEPVGDYRSV